MAVNDIRISTVSIKADVVGVTLLGYVLGGQPVGITPAALWPTLTQLGGVSLSAFNTGLSGKQDLSQRGLANGYAPLGSDGKVPSVNLPVVATPTGTLAVTSAAPSPLGATALAGTSGDAARADHVHAYPTAAQVGAAAVSHTHAISAVTGLQAALDAKQTTSERGAANGYAPLDAGGKVPSANLPPAITQAALDAKADAAATTAALNLKADLAAMNTALAGKAAANDTRIINAVQPDFLTVIEGFTTSYTPVQTDANKLKRCTSASNLTVTLPALAVGTTIRFKQSAAGTITFAAGTNQTITSFGGLLTTGGIHANVIATVESANVWNITGNLV